jgi:glutamate synthase (NADPH/NADH) small chain
LIYGIPGFKLEKQVVERRVSYFRDSGINFRLSTAVDQGGPSFAELRRRHDVLFIATGVYRARDLAAPGSGLPEIVPALEFLTASNSRATARGSAIPCRRSRTAR